MGRNRMGHNPLMALLGGALGGNGEGGMPGFLAEMLESKMRDNPTDRVLQALIDATGRDLIPWHNAGERGYLSCTAVLDDEEMIIRLFVEQDPRKFDEESGAPSKVTVLEFEFDEEVHQLHLNYKGVKVVEMFNAVVESANKHSSETIQLRALPVLHRLSGRFEKDEDEEHGHDCENCEELSICDLPSAVEFRAKQGNENEEQPPAELHPTPIPEGRKALSLDELDQELSAPQPTDTPSA